MLTLYLVAVLSLPLPLVESLMYRIIYLQIGILRLFPLSLFVLFPSLVLLVQVRLQALPGES